MPDIIRPYDKDSHAEQGHTTWAYLVDFVPRDGVDVQHLRKIRHVADEKLCPDDIIVVMIDDNTHHLFCTKLRCLVLECSTNADVEGTAWVEVLEVVAE